MNLRWNPDLRRFEAEFGTDFRIEQPLTKAAGFKTTGPPSWVWYSIKAAPLTKLREDKPPVLTISPEARAEYTRLKEVEDRNVATKAQLAAHTKELKKKLKLDKQDTMKPDEYMDEVLGFVCCRVLPKPAPPVSSYDKVKIIPTERCVVCKEYLFEYEYSPTGPKVCMWCWKNVLDNADDVC
jgi:hypothetical protein